MSDTPRTDALMNESISDSHDLECPDLPRIFKTITPFKVMDLCRTIERELEVERQKKRPFSDALAQEVIDRQVKGLDRLAKELQTERRAREEAERGCDVLRFYAVSLRNAAEPFCAIKADDGDTFNDYAPETTIRFECSVNELRRLRMCAGIGLPVVGASSSVQGSGK